MSKLPSEFVFSQSNLQGFVDCALRFKLRYIDRLQWPYPRTLETQKYETQRRAGDAIHRLIRQYFEGIELQRLYEVASLYGDLMTEWLDQVINAFPLGFSREYQPELRIHQQLAGEPVTAIYDLVVTEAHLVHIIDWKSSLRLPNASKMKQSAQKRLFPLVMAEYLFKQAGHIPALKMSFWELNFPGQGLAFVYTQKQKEEDLTWFSNLSALIRSLPLEEFRATPDQRKCSYCQFQSYCQRPVPEDLADEDALDASIDAEAEQLREAEISEFGTEPV